MKRFLITGGILLVIALLLVVVVFYYVYSITPAPSESETPTTPSAESAVTIPTEAVEIHSNVLTEGQKSALEAVGVEAESFTITPAMIDCAATKIGPDRIAEIANGDSPTLLESGRLLPCLGAE